jgi:hypothetical protein
MPQSLIESRYHHRCAETSDINEHLPTLYKHSLECSHITECGVRTVVSSYAFAYALLGRQGTKLVQVDPVKSREVDIFGDECEAEGVQVLFHEKSDLESPMEDTDLLFIDTWHIYGQLKRELARWHVHAKKYIIMHDTEIDKIRGESARDGHNMQKQSEESGFPIDEINKGLEPAIQEFLADHPEWIIHERYDNNNGLTVLKRVS